MRAVYSTTAGLFVQTEPTLSPLVAHHVNGEDELSGPEAVHVLSIIDDWEEIENEDGRALVESISQRYWVERSARLIMCLLEGVSPELELEVLESIEEILKTRATSQPVLSRLLVAPLRVPAKASSLASTALANGFTATGGLLDSLEELQPLLRRLVDCWTGLPSESFVGLSGSPQELWIRIAKEGRLVQVLQAEGPGVFKAAWSRLAFDEAPGEGVKAIARIGNELAGAIYPTGSSSGEPAGPSHYRGEGVVDEQPSATCDAGRVSGRERRDRALKQVEAICSAVGQGNDRKANRFLRQLIDSQVRTGDSRFAVKSLCNIAQNCADMFRADFERRCLEESLALNANDPWALVQWGNHLKRAGDFQGALEALKRATVSPDDQVALSSIADVWSEQGQYDNAIEVYRSIPNWSGIASVRTGIADTQRHKGMFDQAWSEYEKIRSEWPTEDRPVAGMAEIAKRTGRLDEAIDLYDSLISRDDLEPRSNTVYRLAKCNVLKQANRLNEAFSLADTIVQESPFLMCARIHRSSILGLLGEARQGLKSIPKAKGRPVFGEWIRDYFAGLLLLQLHRYGEARQRLVDRLGNAVLSRDCEVIVRLGAAFSFLSEDRIDDAERELHGIVGSRDYFAQHIASVLQLHVAVARNDAQRIDAICRELRPACERDDAIANAVNQLCSRNFEEARRYELQLLLRVAA